jgi:hypothetical protein
LRARLTGPVYRDAVLRLRLSTAVLLLGSCFAGDAWAEPPPDPSGPGGEPAGAPSPASARPLRWNPAADLPSVADAQRAAAVAPAHGEQRPFVYLMDPSTPLAREASIEYLLQGASGVAATRPLAASIGAQGLVHGLTVSFGVTRWLAPFATALMHQPVGAGDAAVQGTGQGGLRFQLTPAGSAFRAGAAAAFTRELGGALGTYARLSASYDWGRLRLAGNAHVEKIVAAGRDSVDLLAFAGASMRTTEALRLGAEYVGQDLEDAFEREEAEGGARHFAGPVASLQVANDAVWITGGPAFGLNRQSPPFLGRLTVLAAF